MTSALSSALQTFLDEAVAGGAAPGLVAAVFNQKETIATAESGFSSIVTKEPLTLDTTIWPASAAKPFVSLAVLQLVERSGFDLDSHEELVKVLPELGKDFPGSKVWKIFDGKNENGEWKYKDATVGITLRHLLSHTSGFTANFNTEEGAWLYAESMKEGKGLIDGHIAAYNQSRLFEACTAFSYGISPEYLGLFVARMNGTSFRRAIHDLILSPLGVASHSFDTFRTPEMNAHCVDICAHLPDGQFVSLPAPIDSPQFEDVPPEGMSAMASAPFWGSLRAYADALRCLLNESAPAPGAKPLLSRKLWQEASRDDLKARGLSIEQHPFMASTNPMMSTPIDKFSKPKHEGADETIGWRLLQTAVHREESTLGLQPGTLEWTGFFNTYYFIDPARGVGAVVSAQLFPWGYSEMIKVRDDFFKLVNEHVANA
ncbi:hypothetical protein JCM1840_000319 [Sporobolomyces johnsonii]